MSDLQNTFSWSHSASKDFDTCRRRRFWEKYAKWGGWNRQATPVQRKAYQLSKMVSRWSLQGDAAERTAMFVLRQKQKGVSLTATEAFDQVARPFLRASWDTSLRQDWKNTPKSCCLHEHYYPNFTSKTDRELVIETAEVVKRCIGKFIEAILPRFEGVRPDQEVTIAQVGSGGDPEHFFLDDIKVYAIPDYVYREGLLWRIHDWKSGRPREEHAKQLGVYALWAHTKHHVPAEHIQVSIEYMQTGESLSSGITEAELEATRAEIRASASEMAEYLEDHDIVRNYPLPQDEWELAADPMICHKCNFYELCQPELDELFTE